MKQEPSPLRWIASELEALETKDLRRVRHLREGPAGPVALLAGRQILNFGSNDYLGLAGEPALARAAAAEAERSGWGSGASPLVTGYNPAHQRLETALAQFEGTSAALLFGSGYAANAGTIAALIGPGDVVLTDAKNHASIWDGCRLSRADVRVYPHGDTKRLQEVLERSSSAGRRLIVSDSLFSMDGDVAPLGELAGLAARYDSMLLVDEAHATGVFGSRGRGLCEEMGLETEWLIRVGTLSKALGGIGGFVAGPADLINWLLNRARSYVFSTAMPLASAAASLAALELVQAQPYRRQELLQRAAAFRLRLAQSGWDIGQSTSQIIPVRVGTAHAALRLSAELLSDGCYVPAIRPPTVPEGEACLRISLSWSHSEAMLEQLFASLSRRR